MASVGDAWSKLSVVVEELVLNIVDYSNSDYLDVEIMRDEKCITLRFRDGGVPFNPLEKEAPDFSIPMEDRKIGGLGIFLVTKYMDTVTYEHAGGETFLFSFTLFFDYFHPSFCCRLLHFRTSE